MSDRLTDEQVSKIIAEATRLSQRNELEVDQVKEVLTSLNLSPELVDEAMVQIKRREALAVQQRRARSLAFGIAAVAVVAIAGLGFNRWQYQRQVERVGVVQAQIIPATGSATLPQVDRQTSPELYYQVTLSNAPVNRKLSLSCAWKTPSGEIIHENRYQTRRINTATWNTRCRNPLGPASPTGTWTVEMFLGARPISRTTFQVK
ncbi:DUF3859 domain-containing protein [Thermoleptolyngbya sp.]